MSINVSIKDLKVDGKSKISQIHLLHKALEIHGMKDIFILSVRHNGMRGTPALRKRLGIRS